MLSMVCILLMAGGKKGQESQLEILLLKLVTAQYLTITHCLQAFIVVVEELVYEIQLLK